MIDTQSMRISVPVRKIDEIRAMLNEWPLKRTHARIKEVLIDRQVAALHNGYPAWEVHGFGGRNSGLVWLEITILAKPQR